MNYYKRHIGDYAAKAGHLSALEHGVYTLLIDAYYNREEAPTKAEAIRLARARSPEELAAVDAVLTEFFVDVDGKFIQNRIEEELAAFHEKQLVNRQLGAKGGKANAKRIATETLSEREAKQETLREANDKPSHKPLANSHKEAEGGADAPTRQKAAPKPKGVTLREWLADLAGEDAVPAADPIFDWAETQGLPADWLALAWFAFENRYLDDSKTYTDWRAVFRRALRDDWMRLWRHGRNGWELTTAGVQAQREMANV